MPVSARLLTAVLLLSCSATAVSALRAFRVGDEAAALTAELARDPAAVWARVQPLRERYEGDPDFDVLLARAALAVGERGEARLALERVEFIAPETPGVRTLLVSMGTTVDGAEARARYVDPTPAAVDDVDRRALGPLEAQVREQAWERAYETARTMLEEWEGDPAFDYLFGLAALEAGHAEEAVFALQRVLFFDAAQIRVRAQLARAHFVGGDLDQAENEFSRVLAAAPPPEVEVGIRGYLREIESLRNQRSPRLLGSVEFGGGYDTNSNSATRDLTVDTPIGSFPLGDNGVEQSSGYNLVRAQVLYEHPLSRRRTVDMVLAAALRHNFSAGDFDLDVYRFETGYAHEDGAQRVRGSAGITWVTLAGDDFQRSANFAANWTWSPGALRLGAGVGANLIRYADDAARDVDQLMLTLSGEYAQPRDLLSLELYGGAEFARDEDFDFNGRNLAGVTALWRHVAGPGQVPFVRLRLQGALHHDDHPLFAERREDFTQTATLGWNWFLGPELQARAELSYTEARSTLDLFEYDRALVETALRYRF
ncbi:MAG TPA: tetratricopeptide repeat protein [Pseudomonadales bacterium]|nr:tetratricopeptide repeat protein [Pseudomonadales bacterium]